jgi:hypothetical protein
VFHHRLDLICFAPFVIATLGVLSFIGLAVVRWINEHEDARPARALWAALWACGLAMLGLGAALARGRGW